jgi:predicted acyltransferase
MAHPAAFISMRATGITAQPLAQANNASDRLPTRTDRLVSLDALRGFDMFWITGGAGILFGLGKIVRSPVFDKCLDQLKHVPWQGLHFEDLIWPLFMFIMGVAIPFSVAKRRAQGATDRSLLGHALRRAMIMFCLGTITQGNLLLFDLSQFRPCYSVLHGLAAGYFIATVVALKVKAKWHTLTIGVFLLVYWAMIMLIPVPGVGAGVLTPQGNIAIFVDKLVLGRFHYGENTWFLSYLGFGASVLLGVQAGRILMTENTPGRKVLHLVAAGIVSVAVGLLWSLWFPVIKLLWTSSYVLIGGGIGFLALALFYWIIDVQGYQKWAFGFMVIGMNSIAAYFATEVFDFRVVGNVFVGHLLPRLGRCDHFVEALAAFAVVWLILYWMYRNRAFIKI